MAWGAEKVIPRKLDWQDIPIAKIKPYNNNPKIHPQSQIDLIKNMLLEYGWIHSLCIDKDYNLVIGHARIEAAKQLGEDTVPCVFREDLTEAQLLALRIADNKSAELAPWNIDLLEVELAQLQAFDYKLQDVGFKLDELDDIRNANVKQDPNELWENMPEFEQENIMGVREIKVHFQTLEDVDEFAKLVGQEITDTTKYIWFPEQKPLDLKGFACIDDES